jgi:integrase
VPRPPLAVGTHGNIIIRKDGTAWRARTSYRDHDGRLRDISRWGRTRGQASQALSAAIRDRRATTAADVESDATVRTVAQQWLATSLDDVADNTRTLYRYATEHYVIERLGELRLRELTVPILDRALRAVGTQHGLGAAKTTRSVLSGILGYAVRNGALSANIVRDTSPISRKPKKAVRALTLTETNELIAGLRASERANELDLPDLVDWMLGTGMRIGEVCAVREHTIADRTVEVNATVVRVKGAGLTIQERPKTAAGWRVLTLPDHVVAMLERRASRLQVEPPEHVVFPSPRGRLRDPSNTSGDLRAELDLLGFGWVTSHTFRKTVATRLDEAGFTPREIADILGHERPSLTQDVYMGRKVVSARMAVVLAR